MGNDALMEEAEADLANNNDPNNNAEEFADAANQEPELVSILKHFFCHRRRGKFRLSVRLRDKRFTRR
jgi:hypothetical protein